MTADRWLRNGVVGAMGSSGRSADLKLLVAAVASSNTGSWGRVSGVLRGLSIVTIIMWVGGFAYRSRPSKFVTCWGIPVDTRCVFGDNLA